MTQTPELKPLLRSWREALIEAESHSAESSKSIITLYDYLFSDDLPDNACPLLSRLITGCTAFDAIRFDQSNRKRIMQVLAAHSGQMNNDFSLSPPQRQAVLHALNTPEGEIITVTAMPDAEKIAFLQGVIASLRVTAALSGRNNYPPVILACSPNNQHTLNILDNFDNDQGKSKNMMGQRWLPDLQPGKDSDCPWTGLPEAIETAEYLKKAEQHYIQQARAAFKDENIFSVSDVTARLKFGLNGSYSAFKEALEKTAMIEEDIQAQEINPTLSFEEIGIKLSEKISALEKTLQEAKDRQKKSARILEREQKRQRAALKKLEASGFLEKCFSFLPSIKNRALERACNYYKEICRKDNQKRGNITPRNFRKSLDHINRKITELEEQARQSCDEATQSLNNQRLTKQSISTKIKQWQSDYYHPDFPLIKLSDLQNPLDILARHPLSNCASRYWEGRWLQEMNKVMTEGAAPGDQFEMAVKKRFQRRSMIMPCFTSTPHLAPEYFSCDTDEKKPLLNFIDLLIMDEADQVSPESGAAIFALARRALVVGNIDMPEKDIPMGSLMHMAQKATMWALSEEQQT